MKMNVSINFDMDGTIADLYSVSEWLADLESHNPRPYREAKPMVNMSLLSRYIRKAQAMGYEVNIVSWLSKSSNSEYDNAVTEAKLEWLKKHLRSVQFDNIVIVPYGTPKSTCVGRSDLGILFDDEQKNRTEWRGASAEPSEIFEILKGILK
jgi:5'(3')-deoxyribonucleotidase